MFRRRRSAKVKVLFLLALVAVLTVLWTGIIFELSKNAYQVYLQADLATEAETEATTEVYATMEFTYQYEYKYREQEVTEEPFLAKQQRIQVTRIPQNISQKRQQCFRGSQLLPETSDRRQLSQNAEASGILALHYQTFLKYKTGLGNLLFMYATLRGLARRCGLTPALPLRHQNESQFPLAAVFNMNVEKVEMSKHRWIITNCRKCCCCYDRDILEFFDRNNGVMAKFVLFGYFQSWKYFEVIRDELRAELTFLPDTLQTAKDFMNETRNHLCSTSSKRQCAIVGIHVRRTDMLHPARRTHGYVAANLSYILLAMRLLKQTHPHQQLAFLILGDDFDWNNATFSSMLDGTVTSVPRQHTAAVDLCLLTLCDHLIITTGTFGWWAAYLLQKSDTASVVYFRNHVRPKSRMGNGTRNEDYFLPDWIGLP